MLRLFGGILLLALAINAPANAQTAFPNRSVKIIVPTTPGGVTDILARVVAQGLTQSWGQSVIVENRAGGAELIGTGAAAKSPADGYTLLLTGSSPITAAPHLHKQMPYDPMKDLTLIALLGQITPMMHVIDSLPVKTVQEYIALARAKPDTLNYGSMGTGTYPHIAMEDFKLRTGTQMQHIGYKGASGAAAALLRGEITMLIVNMGNLDEHVKAGKVRIIAAAGAQRAAARPDIPTIAESAVPGFSTGSWWGMFGPANLPSALVEKIRADVDRNMDAPEARKLLEINTLERINIAPADYVKFVQDDLANQGRQIKAAGIQPE